jgi:hypothetical protein
MNNIDEIDFGFAKVWNFIRKKDVYISDESIKSKITRILSCYKSQNNSLINDIGVVYVRRCDFRKFNDKELGLVREVRHLLFLSCLSKNNTCKYNCNSGHKMFTADNFDIIYQNFILEGDSFSERSGEIINFSRSGYRLGNIVYQRPGFVPTPLRFEIDNDLLAHLIELKGKKPKIYGRILNATEIFFGSYYNSHYVSRNARILLQMNSFEMLLQFPKVKQREYFRRTIKNLTVHNADREYIYNVKDKGKIIEPLRGHKYTLKEIWADQFYSLRNKIIHGQRVDDDDFIFKKSQCHYNIAVLFFILLIKKQIEKSLRNKKYNCDFEINWEKWRDDISQPEALFNKGFVYNYSNRRIFNRMFG